MRKFLIAAVAMSGLMFSTAAVVKAANEDGKDKGWNGVLIDSACAKKQKTEADAADHPKSCAMKEGCAKSGYGIFKDDAFIKFDEKGNEAAKKYLAEEDHSTKVHVTGKLSDDGKSIMVDEIHPQAKDDDKKKD